MDEKDLLKLVSSYQKKILPETRRFLAGKTIVDIGCGNGLTSYFLSRNAKVKPTLTDIQDIRMPQASKFLFKKSSANKLPFKDKEFEVSYMQFVLHHMKKSIKLHNVLREAKRISKIIIIVEELRNSKTDINEARKFDAKINKMIHEGTSMPIVQYYSDKEIKRAISKTQLKIIKSRIVDEGNRENGFLETRIYVCK